MNTPAPLIPLTLVALEVDGDANALAVKLGDEITLDAAGLRCIPVDTAADLIADHRVAVQAQRDRQRRERAAARARPNRLRERRRALPSPRFDGGGQPLPALAVMTQGDVEAKQAASAERLDEYLAAQLVRHPIREGDR